MKSRTGPQLLVEILAALLLTTLVCGAFWMILSELDGAKSWPAIWSYRQPLLDGWVTSLQVSAGALAGSCVVAALLVAGQRSGLTVVQRFTRGFVELVRGMPLLSLVLIGFYVVLNNRYISDALNMMGLGGKVSAGILLLSVFTGAYLAEILRGGLESIPQAQIDSARAVGFDRRQVMKHVIFPQALRRVLPSLAGQFVSLVKDSSLLCVIGIEEFTYQAKTVYSATYLGVEAFLPLAVGYLLLTLPIAGFSHWLERRLKAETAG
ncbi:MAG: amino acid transporter rane protein family [Verrucomicrobiales bacterium]|nr:amino acid transporter rane protein family [Verrucomicrobiales bacterium]